MHYGVTLNAKKESDALQRYRFHPNGYDPFSGFGERRYGLGSYAPLVQDYREPLSGARRINYQQNIYIPNVYNGFDPTTYSAPGGSVATCKR